jgi:hypothetical protein
MCGGGGWNPNLLKRLKGMTMEPKGGMMLPKPKKVMEDPQS